MTFDIHQLDRVKNDFDAVMAALPEYIEQLIKEFASSPEAAQLLADQPDLAEYLGGWIYPLLDMGYAYEEVLLPQMKLPQVQLIVQNLFPRKISLLDPAEAEGAIPELIAFWQYLQRVYKLSQAKKIIPFLQQMQPQFVDLMTDENNFGIAKAFFMSGQAQGFDMTTMEGLQQFQQVYNQSLNAAPPGLKGFGELLAANRSTPNQTPPAKSAKGFGKLSNAHVEVIDFDDDRDVELSDRDDILDHGVIEQIPPELAAMLFGFGMSDDEDEDDDQDNFFRQMQRERIEAELAALPALTATQLELLEQQQITTTIPGPIVADFQRFLEFVGEKGVPVGATHHLISTIATLAALNQTLTHPLQIDLKRPQQKSYPPINGLYLLARCTGLGKIVMQGKKPHLVIDADRLQEWQRLNPTEQYFTLLEAWLVRGHEEILGERSGPFNCGSQVIQSWRWLPERGKKLARYSDQQNLHYYPGLLNLALLESFGLVKIASVKPEAGKGWRFKSVKPLAWGNVVVQLVTRAYCEQDHEWPSERDGSIAFGELQPTFQAYFPTWQQNLPAIAAGEQAGVFTFKVTLGKVWLRIAVSGTTRLCELADWILESVGFDRDHLDMFVYWDAIGRKQQVHHPYADGKPKTTKVTVGELPIGPGSVLEYIFDFGDWWEFQLLLEAVEPEVAGQKLGIVESKGKSPEQYPDWEEME